MVNISKSAETKAQKGDYEDFAKKQEKNLGKRRKSVEDIDEDEITGEPLTGNGEFHHANKKSIYTDPVKRLDPNEGIIVNSKTHTDIHRNNINDKKALEDYKKLKQKKQ